MAERKWRKARACEIVANAIHLGVILGGPLLGLIAIQHYPVLIPDRLIYIGGLGGIALFFLASFAVFRRGDFPRGMPLVAKLVFRAGWGLGATFLVVGVAGILNGYGMPIVAREAVVVAKHPTLHRDPARRTYYVAIRAWPQSRAVVELGAPRAVYDRLAVPVSEIDTPEPVLEALPDADRVRLTVGEGRFGWEWLGRVDLP